MLNAEFSYDREEMHIVDLRTGEQVEPLHKTRRQLREEARGRREAEARIAELEARLSSQQRGDAHR